MLHANRNGFFYVFDRRDGTLLLAKPFVKNLTWASGIGADGRPVKLPDQEPTTAGTQGLPVAGWRNQLVRAVLQSRHRPLLRADVREVQRLHQERPGGMGERPDLPRRDPARPPDPKPQRILRALDMRTGQIAWELPQAGPADSWGGTLRRPPASSSSREDRRQA